MVSRTNTGWTAPERGAAAGSAGSRSDPRPLRDANAGSMPSAGPLLAVALIGGLAFGLATSRPALADTGAPHVVDQVLEASAHRDEWLNRLGRALAWSSERASQFIDRLTAASNGGAAPPGAQEAQPEPSTAGDVSGTSPDEPRGTATIQDTAASSCPPLPGGWRRVAARDLMIRERPDGKNITGGPLTRNQRVKVLEVSDKGRWAKVRTEDGRDGFVLAEYLIVGCS